MEGPIFGEFSKFFLKNIETIRDAIQRYREEKAKLEDAIIKKIGSKYTVPTKGWDKEIEKEIVSFEMMLKSDKNNKSVRLDISPEKMAEQKVLIIFKEKEAGRWKEKTKVEVDITDKSAKDVADEIVEILEKNS